MESVTINFDAMEWERWDKKSFIGRVKACTNRRKRIRLLDFPPSFCEEKWCITPYQGYVIEGDFEIEFEDKTVKCSKNMGFVIPPGKHKLKSNSNARVLLFVIDDI